MGEIADSMINGLLCCMCGVVLDGEEPGFPRYCSKDCAEGIKNAVIVGEESDEVCRRTH